MDINHVVLSKGTIKKECILHCVPIIILITIYVVLMVIYQQYNTPVLVNTIYTILVPSLMEDE